MPVITGEWEIEGEKLRVWTCHYLTDDPGDNPKGFYVESIPDYPPPERGVDTTMYFDPRTSTIYFESTPRPLNQEELQQEANEKIPGLTTAARLTVSPLIVAGSVDQRGIADLKTLYAEWETGTAYAIGNLCVYEGILYGVIQAHTSQSDWTPPITPALFKRHHSYGDEFRQPTGAHDTYKLNDVVTYNGELWRNTSDNNAYAPGVWGWVLVE